MVTWLETLLALKGLHKFRRRVIHYSQVRTKTDEDRGVIEEISSLASKDLELPLFALRWPQKNFTEEPDDVRDGDLLDYCHD